MLFYTKNRVTKNIAVFPLNFFSQHFEAFTLFFLLIPLSLTHLNQAYKTKIKKDFLRSKIKSNMKKLIFAD